MKYIFTILIITLFFCSCDTFKSVDEYFSEAEQMRSEGKSKEALKVLNKIIKKFSKDIKASDAQYLIAEIYYRDLQENSQRYLVEVRGFEPPASSSRTKHATRLRHTSTVPTQFNTAA